jgi:hypothetical protein
MTRARSFLDIVLRENSKAPLAGLLRGALGVKPWVFDGIPMRECDDASGKNVPQLPDPGIAVTPVRDAGDVAPAVPKGRATYVTPSSREEGGEVRVTSILAPSNRAAMQRGELIHAWLAQVAWIEDGLPDAGTLLESAADIATDMSREELEDLAEGLLGEMRDSGSALHACLSRPAEVPELWRERRFAVVHETAEGPELLSGSFDRVLLWHDAKGRACRAQIIDFKTDRFSNPEERAKVESRYEPQLAAYRKALGILRPDLNARSILASLVFVRGGGESSR